ncbi:MAG: endolytic transglycosylase MltG [Lachnospiraceae bacterium]|nr:endolytic transglycosylase MltG [Candidatus Minthocola equi]
MALNSDNTYSVSKTVISVIVKVIVIVAVLIALYFGISRGYKFGYDIFSQKAVDQAPGRDVEVTIYDDMTNSEIADVLYGKGLIVDRTSFSIFLWLFTDSDYGIVSGNYTLNSSMTAQQIIQTISQELEKETTAEPTLGLYETSVSEGE